MLFLPTSSGAVSFSLLVTTSLCLVACGEDLNERSFVGSEILAVTDGAPPQPDIPSARTNMDAAVDERVLPPSDATVLTFDSLPSDADTTSHDGATPSADAGHWGPCSVMGANGQCVHVNRCGEGMRSVPGHCPGPPEIQCCVPGDARFDCDPEEEHRGAVPIPAPRQADCPDGMVEISNFCIDRYEAALVDTDGQWSPYHNPGATDVAAVSAADVVPQGYINGRQAAAACERAGKRLCTSGEWLRACQGENGWTYPYGAELVPGRCNDHRATHPAVELFPDAPNPFALIQNACINQLPNGLARTGAYADCSTPEGVHDLMGNLHEWVADADGTFRGGFYVDTIRNGPGCLYRTTAHDRSHWDYSTGFRCCSDGLPL